MCIASIYFLSFFIFLSAWDNNKVDCKKKQKKIKWTNNNKDRLPRRIHINSLRWFGKMSGEEGESRDIDMF